MSPATKLFFLTILSAAILTANTRIIMNEDPDPSDNEVTSSLHTELKRFGRKLHGPEDQAVGELVKSYNPTEHKVNPEELGSYVEGDLLFPHREGRNGLSDMSARWSKGIVPYEIAGSFSGNELALIQQAMQAYHAKTCIRFKKRAGEKDYIVITNSNSGCWSSVGRIGGKQEVNLQTPGCMTKVGTAIHELMHAVGFLHEQNRFERDSFVRIAFQNIKPGVESNFDKASEKSTNAFGVGYDYGSIMHYSANAFSTNGQPTIVALKSGGSQMGQRNGFSQADINKINAMYLCRPGGGATGVGSVAPARPANNGFLGLVGNIFGWRDGNSTETHDGDSNDV